MHCVKDLGSKGRACGRALWRCGKSGLTQILSFGQRPVYHVGVKMCGSSRRLASLSIGALLAILSALVPAPIADAEGTQYEGVRPGGDSLPPGSIRAGQGRYITFPGFQMLDGGRSRVFVQTAVRMEPTVRRIEGGFELFLEGARIPLRTNRLPLETEHFETPLSRVTVKQEQKGVAIRLQMRKDIGAISPRVVEGKDGYFFILVELPPLAP